MSEWGRRGTQRSFIDRGQKALEAPSSKYGRLESGNAPREVSLAVADYGEMHVSEIRRNVAFLQIEDGATSVHETCVIQNHDVPRLPSHRTFQLVAYGLHLGEQVIGNGFPVFERRENPLAIEVASEKQEISKCRFVAEHRLVQGGHQKVAMDYAVDALERVRTMRRRIRNGCGIRLARPQPKCDLGGRWTLLV